MSLGPLFEEIPPYQRHSSTSKAAAERIRPASSRLRDLVKQTIRNHPEGMTDEEIATTLGLNPSTARPRRIELVQRGEVVEVGQRKGRSGRAMTVWQVRP